jgi:hypothetical protein
MAAGGSRRRRRRQKRGAGELARVPGKSQPPTHPIHTHIRKTHGSSQATHPPCMHSAQLHSSSRTPSQKLRRRQRSVRLIAIAPAATGSTSPPRMDKALTIQGQIDRSGSSFCGFGRKESTFYSFRFISLCRQQCSSSRDENQLISRKEMIELGKVNLVFIPVPSARDSQCSSCRDELIDSVSRIYVEATVSFCRQSESSATPSIARIRHWYDHSLACLVSVLGISKRPTYFSH